MKGIAKFRTEDAARLFAIRCGYAVGDVCVIRIACLTSSSGDYWIVTWEPVEY